MGNIAFNLPDFAALVTPLDAALIEDRLIGGFLHSAREHLGLEIAFIARWVDGEEREITHVDTDLDLPLGPGFRQHRDETYCWHILNGRLPELIDDPADHPFTSSLPITAALPVGCHLNVPLKLSDGTVWGSFCALSRAPDRTMNSRDLAILDSFASMAAERIDALVTDAPQRSQTRDRIEGVLGGDAVTIFQQPIHSLKTGQPVGVECLARFPDVNKRGPGAWFDDAETAGLGEQLEMTAVRGALEISDSVPDGFVAFVKAPARIVLNGEMRAALATMDAANVIITLTQYLGETAHEELATQLEAIRPRARTAVDRVGIQYESLKMIAAIKPDYVKLDMALTRGIAIDAAARTMVAAIVSLTRSFGGNVVAEGIETEAEAAAMADLGVDYGQGYHFARPLPMVAATQHLLGIFT